MVNKFPFTLEEKTHLELSLNETLAINFITILNRLNLEKEHIVKISEILWPIMFIQSEPNAKLVIDNVGVLFFENKIPNAPRSAQVGHILRNKDLEYLERLKKAKSIIKFQETIEISEQQTDVSDNEYLIKKIPGLFPPEILNGLGKMMKYVKPVDLSKIEQLESQYSFDDALDYAQEWIELLNFIRGTKHRWKTLIDLVTEPIEKWKLDLKVQLKDVDDFYKKKIKNLDQIDDASIKAKMDEARNNIDQWILQEQKSIIERIGKLFIRIDLLFEDANKHNSEFLQLDTLKTRKIGDVVVDAFQNVAFLREILDKSNNELDLISNKINHIREELEKTNLSAEEKVALLAQELQMKKEEQEQKIQNLKQEHSEKIRIIQKNLDELSTLEQEILSIIDEKMKECMQTENEIRKWQINDEITNIRNPTSKFYIPIGIALIEDDDFEERFEIILPSIIGPNLSRKPFSDAFFQFEKDISEILDDDMKLRSNFEFTLEKSVDYRKNIEVGIKNLFDKELINIKMKQKYSSLLSSLK
ncbi:MAG: coiled-coil domain-containing protein [Promethearchaeota archaeon]